MIAKNIVLSNIINVVSDNILLICIQESLLMSKKVIVLFHTLSAYNSLLVRYKFARLIPGNVCVQAECMLKPMKTLVFIQYHVKRIL